MLTAEKPIRRIVLFANEEKVESMRKYIAEQRTKLVAAFDAYTFIRETSPEIFPQFSFEMLAEIIRTKNPRAWLFDRIMQGDPLHAGHQLEREVAIKSIRYPVGTESFISSMNISTYELNFQAECFSVGPDGIEDIVDGIERKIDSCRRYATATQVKAYECLERAAVEFNKVLGMTGLVLSYQSPDLFPKGLRAHYPVRGAEPVLIPDSEWISKHIRDED